MTGGTGTVSGMLIPPVKRAERCSGAGTAIQLRSPTVPQARHAYSLPNRPESVGRARAWVRTMLTADGHADAIDTASLIVSELATNALVHGDGSEITIVCEADSGILTIGAVDYGTDHPAILDATEDDESGRGLALVDAIADEWGYEPCDGGKLVYARLKLAQEALAEIGEPCFLA